MYEAPL